MGKAKKTRSISHKKRVPPTGGPSRAELEEAQAQDYSTMAPDEAQMFKGLVDLQGSIREATCVALATMYGDADSEEVEAKNRAKLQRMVDAGLLKKLVPRMVDPLPMVRLHAVGALRNMSVTGGLELCEEMTRQNTVTPLVKIISENTTDDNLASGGEGDLQAVRLLEQAVALLSNLCESCQAALNELTQGQLLEPIMKIAAQARTHTALHLETLKLLLLITEGNARLSELFGASAAYQQIIGDIVQAPAEQQSLQIKLHAVGVAMNVRAIMQEQSNVARLLPVLERALAYDPVSVVQLAQQTAESWSLAQKSLLGDEDVDDDTLSAEEEQAITAAQLKVRTWRDSVRTLTLALELVAELAAAGDDVEDEDEWASDDEDAMEEYAASHMDADAGESSANACAKALGSSRVFPLCVAILQGLVSVPELSAAAVAADFERMRVRVCNSVNNLLQSASWESLGEDVVPQVFRNLCALYSSVQHGARASSASAVADFALESSAANDLEVAVTAAMGSALRRAGAESRQLPLSAEDAQLILRCATEARAVEARVNAVRMLGCVGQRCASAAENEAVGRCLASRLDDASLEVAAEALNAIFDMFGDEERDDTFRALQLLSALERVSGALKNKLKAEQKTLDRALVAHVKETRLNLLRFVKYKKQHL